MNFNILLSYFFIINKKMHQWVVFVKESTVIDWQDNTQ